MKLKRIRRPDTYHYNQYIQIVMTEFVNVVHSDPEAGSGNHIFRRITDEKLQNYNFVI